MLIENRFFQRLPTSMICDITKSQYSAYKSVLRTLDASSAHTLKINFCVCIFIYSGILECFANVYVCLIYLSVCIYIYHFSICEFSILMHSFIQTGRHFTESFQIRFTHKIVRQVVPTSLLYYIIIGVKHFAICV